jgi:hypothetical protein
VSNIMGAREALVACVLEGEGQAPRTLRRAAFEGAGLAEPLRTLIHKVAARAYTATDDDIAAAKASGLSEGQIFEIVVCAAIGQSARQHDAALAALAAATGSPDAPRDR